jgi:curli biogenesis system outer membrane secretion channel CsgG
MLKRTISILAVFFLLFSLSCVSSMAKMKRSEPSTERTYERDEKVDYEEETVVYQPYTGVKKRIAVSGFENKSGWRGEANLGDGMAEMLVTALHNTGRFIVVEREALEDILGEQRLQEQGKLAGLTGPRVNRLIGAQTLIRGAVTEFESSKAAGGGGIIVEGIGIGVGGKVAHVGLDIRMYDTSTGEILQSHRAVGEAKTTGMAIGGVSGDVGFGVGGFQKTPLGQATRKAINSAVDFIVMEMEDIPWQSSIIKVSGETVYITGGRDMNLSTGSCYTVYGVGEELIDPMTGLSLGSEESRIGRIEITSVEDKYSKAKILEGSGFKTGDVVR